MIRKIDGDRKRGYTSIGNDVFHDKTLSLKAVGLLCFLWSLPEDWDVSASGLASGRGETVKTVREVIRELEAAGYLKKQKNRDGGRFAGYDVELFELPCDRKREDGGREDGTPEDGTPEDGKPKDGFRHTIKYNKYKKKIENTKKENPSEGIFDKVKF